jgi:putative isomerase
MAALDNLHNRIDLFNIPFSDRGSRLLLFRRDNTLFIRLVERWVKWEQEFGNYRHRPPIIDNFTFLDSTGEPLEFETDTYPHVVEIRPSTGRFDWVFVDPETILVRLPAGTYGFSFEAQTEEAQSDRRGGTLHGRRNIAYTTDARILSNDVLRVDEAHVRVHVRLKAEDDDVLLLNVTPRIAYNRAIPSPEKTTLAAKATWQEWFDATPLVLDSRQSQYDYAWWVMRVGLLNPRYYFTREALVPSKIHYVGVWHWDQFFHAIAYRHVDTRLAEDQLRIIVDHQQSDGMFPDAVHDEGLITHLTLPVEADVTKPPLMAWAALKLYEVSNHLDFLDEIYEALLRSQDWWTIYNRDERGLYVYRHPFSSGLDDSPLWDYGMPVASPDLNTYVYIQLESLARIADLLGDTESAAGHREQAQALVNLMIRHMWDKEKGIFNALHEGKPIPVLTPFNLLPLWTGALPEAMTRRLLAHLTDPAEFWPAWPMPSVSLSDPHFDPEQMWRGPTWPNINYLFIEALQRIGETDLAVTLRRRTLDLLMKHGDIYEYYHPITGENPPKAASIFGWSSAVFIDLAIQEKGG